MISRRLGAVLLALLALGLESALAAPDVGPLTEVQRDGLTIRAAVPDAGRIAAIFGEPLLSKGVQPVFVEISNPGPEPVWYLPIVTDPTYFSPAEVARRFSDPLRPEADAARAEAFEASRMPLLVPPGGTASGFVFTHFEPGLKFVSIAVLKGGERLDTGLIVPVEGEEGEAAMEAILDRYGAAGKKTVDLDSLRAALAALPCCTTNAEGTAKGDPINLVIVGDGLDALFPLIRRGWRFAEPLTVRSAEAMGAAFVFDRADAVAPVSPLYFMGRKQDLAVQKARSTISERNHLRLWLSPLTIDGQSVWVGQISRDIGVELTDKSWYGTTHKIDPDVDFDRDYLLQDVLMSGGLERFGYVAGVGASAPPTPRVNLTGDPYITDGLRLIVFLRDAATTTLDLDSLDWEQPAR